MTIMDTGPYVVQIADTVLHQVLKEARIIFDDLDGIVATGYGSANGVHAGIEVSQNTAQALCPPAGNRQPMPTIAKWFVVRRKHDSTLKYQTSGRAGDVSPLLISPLIGATRSELHSRRHETQQGTYVPRPPGRVSFAGFRVVDPHPLHPRSEHVAGHTLHPADSGRPGPLDDFRAVPGTCRTSIR